MPIFLAVSLTLVILCLLSLVADFGGPYMALLIVPLAAYVGAVLLGFVPEKRKR